MNTENIPQVGSKWDIGGGPIEVTGVKKRGRGHQVHLVVVTDTGNFSASPMRLRDFLKAAKPL